MKRITTGLSAQSTLLDLLSAGCAVEFPNGARLKGVPRRNDIDLRDDMGFAAGTYSLTPEGVEQSLADPDLFPAVATD